MSHGGKQRKRTYKAHVTLASGIRGPACYTMTGNTTQRAAEHEDLNIYICYMAASKEESLHVTWRYEKQVDLYRICYMAENKTRGPIMLHGGKQTSHACYIVEAKQDNQHVTRRQAKQWTYTVQGSKQNMRDETYKRFQRQGQGQRIRNEHMCHG